MRSSRFCEILVQLHVYVSAAEISFWCFISLHMWETICDAWACWSGWKFGPNSTEYPYPEIQNTPSPPKMKIVRDLGTLTFQFQNIPPPKKIEI